MKTSVLQSRLWYFCSVTFKAFRVLLINVILPRPCGDNSNLINHPNVHIFRCNLLSSQIITEISAHSYVMTSQLGLSIRTRRILRSGYSDIHIGLKISILLLLRDSALLMRHKHQNSSTDSNHVCNYL